MERQLDYSRVLHLGDPAHTATLLAQAARDSDRNWKVLQLSRTPRLSNSVLRIVAKAGRGLAWETCLALARIRFPRVHLHSAMALPHVGWALGDYALHLHGTDIRTRRYEKVYAQRIRKTVLGAKVVFYSTPDLAEHTLDWRPDAQLVPVPVPLDTPVVDNPLRNTGKYVFFVSRFEAVKGGEAQVAAARALRAALPDTVSLIGLDWGDPALLKQVAATGVRLIPRLSLTTYRQVIRDAAVCVGQTAGILSASELESLAENVPLVAPLNPDWYTHTHPSLRNVPVWGGTQLSAQDSEAIAQLVLAALDEPPQNTRKWVECFHSPAAALAEVLKGYRRADW